MTIDKVYMLTIIHKLVEDIKAKELDYGMNGAKVQISFGLAEAQILLEALSKTESEKNTETKEKCPICEYEFDMCQCRFGGNAHPDRSKIARVVADHIYLLSEKQIEHLKQVQKWWHTSYGDEEMNQILNGLESEEKYDR